jgi:carbonic anhydrase
LRVSANEATTPERRGRSTPGESGDDTFADVLAANERYADGFSLHGLAGRAARGLAVLTCMDTRLDPLAMLGLSPGEAKILRNAGGRVTPEILDTLVVSAYLLDVDRVMVIEHTRCRMAGGGEADVHAAIAAAGGPDTRSLSFRTAGDQRVALASDVQRVRSSPYLGSVTAAGFLYDVDTGRLQPVC